MFKEKFSNISFLILGSKPKYHSTVKSSFSLWTWILVSLFFPALSGSFQCFSSVFSTFLLPRSPLSLSSLFLKLILILNFWLYLYFAVLPSWVWGREEGETVRNECRSDSSFPLPLALSPTSHLESLPLPAVWEAEKPWCYIQRSHFVQNQWEHLQPGVKWLSCWHRLSRGGTTSEVTANPPSGCPRLQQPP